MAKISKRIRRSYEAYLSHRESYRERGYGLDRELSLEEYEEAHLNASQKGETHIARKLASNETTFTRNEAAAIKRRLKEADKYEDVNKEELKALKKKYKTAKSIYGLQLSEEEAALQEEIRREYYTKRGIIPKRPIQANARSNFFNELMDLGLSYREADSILYGNDADSDEEDGSEN